MPDIRLVRDKNRAYVIGTSDKGIQWIQKNIELDEADFVSVRISIDLIEDMREALKKEGLEVA